MAEFTFLEVHLDDPVLAANAPSGSGDREDADVPPEPDSGGRRGAVLALVVGVAFSVAVAYLARRTLREDPSEEPLDAAE
ncbi:hypothetical protein [Natronomonas sp.]|uniref:hypothetical protein n=1 Tax=Natronomonas sp. TaxID=2184060 RepID=UPI0026227180|nr:hypothetical protein [Natronomonas sp.]